MFSVTRISLVRPIAATGIIAAALVAPARAEAQTVGDVALLNRLAPTIYIPSTLSLVWGGAPTPATAVDGEIALLARTPPVQGDPRLAGEGVPGGPVSGAYALLGRRDPGDSVSP